MGPRCLAEPGEGFMTCVVNLDLNLHSLWIFVFNILPASMDLGVKDHVLWRNLLASIFRSSTTINCCLCLASSGAPWRCCRCRRGCRQRHVLGNLPAGFLRHLKELGNTCYPEQSLRVCLELFGQTHYHWIPTNVAKLMMKISTLQGTNISHLGNRKNHLQNAILGGYVSSLEGSQLELEIGFWLLGIVTVQQEHTSSYILSFHVFSVWGNMNFHASIRHSCWSFQSESNNKQGFPSYHIIEIYSEYNRAKH